MTKDSEFWNIQQVAAFFGVSESTIRRRLRDRRNGVGTFLVPAFGFGKIARFRRVDVENWCEEVPEIVTVETPAQQNHKIKVAQEGLAGLGIKVQKKK